MDYCAPRGLPHSIFLTWAQDDQDAALAWEVRRMQLCPGCGTNPRDWKNDEGRAAIPPPYEWEAMMCYGCQERERLVKSLGDKPPDGMFVIPMPTDYSEYDPMLWNIDATA